MNYNSTSNQTALSDKVDEYQLTIDNYGQGKIPDFDMTLGANELTTAN